MAKSIFPAGRGKSRPKTAYIYGYDLAISTADPYSRVYYPDDVDNANYVPASMDFTNGVFSYGSWPGTPGEGFMPKPCMLGFDGVVKAFLDPWNYAQDENGNAISGYSSHNYPGNAMMQWPKIYTRRWSENGAYHFRCSNRKIDRNWECWSNYDKFDHEIDYFYTPIYFGSKDSANRLRSISGQSNFVGSNSNTEVGCALNNGADLWYIECAADRFLIQDLLALMFKSTNLQAALGTGRCASGLNSAVGQGSMNTKGLFWGARDQQNGVKVFGMENWWGNLWRRTAGWFNVNGTQKVKLTRGNKDGSTASDYNFDGTGYLTVDGATPTGGNGGYIRLAKAEPYGRIPYTTGGSQTTFECDAFWYVNSTVNYAVCGGAWNHALNCGPFYIGLQYQSIAGANHTGAALSCKPPAN